MDTSLEGFFYKREYNLANFNFLLQVLAEQKKFDEALKAFEKMKVTSKATPTNLSTRHSIYILTRLHTSSF
jgi:pentatricopeptide repeat domain (PPR motif)